MGNYYKKHSFSGRPYVAVSIHDSDPNCGIQSSSTTEFASATEISFSAWFYPTDWINFGNLLYAIIGNGGFAFRHNGGSYPTFKNQNMNGVIGNGSTFQTSNAPSMSHSLKNWHLYSYTYSDTSNEIKFYVDGYLIGTVSNTISIDASLNNPIQLVHGTASSKARGYRGPCALTKTIWDASEISRQWNNGSPTDFLSTSDHIWMFDEGSGTSIADTGDVGGLDMTMSNFDNTDKSGWISTMKPVMAY